MRLSSVRLGPPRRCLLLIGGNAAGKTTAFLAAQARHAHRHDITWHTADTGPTAVKATLEIQIGMLLPEWEDPRVTVLAIEGMRIYGAIFRIFAQRSAFPRHLQIGAIRRTAADTYAQVEARCVQKGKGFQAAYWQSHAEYEGNQRYANAVQKLLREHPAIAPRVTAAEFWMDREYQALADVGQWIDAVLNAQSAQLPGPLSLPA